MDYITFSKKLAYQAGKIITDNFAVGIKKVKDDLTPLTAADTKINDLTKNAVQSNFPDHEFLGEEGGSFNKNRYRGEISLTYSRLGAGAASVAISCIWA